MKNRDVRLYVEGGYSAESRKKLRRCFRTFLEKGDEAIRRNRELLQIVFCGGKSSTCDDFQTGLAAHPKAFNILLVDSDAPKDFALSCKQHLGLKINGVEESQFHLMVQEIEAWFLADLDALQKFYGGKFKEKSIRNRSIEQIDQPKEVLKKACQKDYDEIDDAASLLEIIDVAKVRQAAPHCERLFQTLTEKMQ